MNARLLTVAAVIGLPAVGLLAQAENWPNFRGTASGVAEAHLPAEWGMEKNIAWKAKIPGYAWSQPIVIGDKIFVTTAVTDNQTKPQAGFGGGRGGRPGFGPPGGPGPDGENGPPPRPGFGPPPGGLDRPPRPDGPPSGPDGERPSRGPGRGGFGRGPGGGPGRGGFGRPQEPPQETYRWEVVCLDGNSGEILWEKVAREGRPGIPTQSSNTYASETPVTDGERIYAYFGMTGIYCFDLEGNQLWGKEWGAFPMRMGWGTGSSPALHGDHVFVQCDNDEKSFIVALNKLNGEEAWRVERDEESNWSTPLVWTNRVRTELVTSGGNKVRSYDPATGDLLWELDLGGGNCNASPIGDNDMLYVGRGGGFGGGGPLIAVKAGANGDISLAEGETSNAGVAWSESRGGPPMASPILYQGCLYVLDQRGGIINCYNAKTGERHYRERLPDARGFTSSPWASDGKVFCLDEDGRTFVIAAGPEFKLVGANKLDEMFWSSAAVLGDKLLLRGVDHLYCIAQ